MSKMRNRFDLLRWRAKLLAMRFFISAIFCLLVASSLTTGTALADEPTKAASAGAAASSVPQDRIDGLYRSLKKERDPDKAAAIAEEIRNQLEDSGSATIALLMQWADKAIQDKKTPAALDFLDQAIALKPSYTGSWNKRATLNFTLGNYRRSMADVRQILIIDPRNLDALAGMAALLQATDEDRMALEAWQRYLDVFPADRTAQEQVGTLSEKLAGSRT